ncbi:hypothetical protein U9M48_037673 [Paspalum notatum var. saurae]|uniref:Uncharacterized protein n=1 Tax=Paspalum notatum var. saurae TaxID=547442 RepID=A0AAQ3UFI5_PASNO
MGAATEADPAAAAVGRGDGDRQLQRPVMEVVEAPSVKIHMAGASKPGGGGDHDAAGAGSGSAAAATSSSTPKSADLPHRLSPLLRPHPAQGSAAASTSRVLLWSPIREAAAKADPHAQHPFGHRRPRPPQRRDDSIIKKKDGIATTIEHCNESLHRGCSES